MPFEEGPEDGGLVGQDGPVAVDQSFVAASDDKVRESLVGEKTLPRIVRTRFFYSDPELDGKTVKNTIADQFTRLLKIIKNMGGEKKLLQLQVQIIILHVRLLRKLPFLLSTNNYKTSANSKTRHDNHQY